MTKSCCNRDEKVISHNHNDSNDHNHSRKSVYLYIIGLVLYIIGLFIPIEIVKNILFILAFLLSGYEVMIGGIIDTIKQSRIHKRLRTNIHILMTLGAIGAIIIGEYSEAAVLILIFAGAHFLENYVEGKSQREITNLLKLNPITAKLVKKDGTTEEVLVDQVEVGDVIRVLNGDQVPLDGIVINGNSTIDQSSITGESIPVYKNIGDQVFASTINGNGSLDIEVTHSSKDTLFSKIIEMVSQAKTNISKTAALIKKIEPIYVNIVLLLTPFFYVLMYFGFGFDFQTSFYRTMVFLIVTSPCALAATDIPATLSAISNLAKVGMLFKGGRYLSNIADIKVIAFDKTGTLTEGEPMVTNLLVLDKDNSSNLENYLNIIYSMELQANHPLANAITTHLNSKLNLELIVDNIIGYGLSTKYLNQTYFLGKKELFSDSNALVDQYADEFSKEGKTLVYFGTKNKIEIIIAVLDIEKESAKDMIEYFNNVGIQTVMITGDNEVTANAIGSRLEVSHTKSNILPDAKANLITELRNEYGNVLMAGDGVNDAPALAVSDIGVAMKKGTDVAIEVADAVLVNDDLKVLSYAHRISRKLRSVVIQNIIFSMLVVFTLVALNILGLMNMSWAVLLHEGSTIVVILNGLRLLKKI